MVRLRESHFPLITANDNITMTRHLWFIPLKWLGEDMGLCPSGYQLGVW